jgi:hypothetical protein
MMPTTAGKTTNGAPSASPRTAPAFTRPDPFVLLRACTPSLRRALANPVTWGWVGLGVSFTLLYFRLVANPAVLNHWWNFDTLYAVHVYADVVTDGYPFSGWRFPIANWIFPDVCLASLWVALSGSPGVAMFGYGLTQALLLAAGFLAGARWAGVRGRLCRVAILATGAALTCLAVHRLHAGYPPYQYLFFPVYHTGTYVLAVWCAALALLLLRDGAAGRRGWFVLLLFGLLCGLGALGNLLFLVYLLLPLSLALGFGVLLALVPFRRALVPLAASWLGSAPGFLLQRRLFDATELQAESAVGIKVLCNGLHVYLTELHTRLVHNHDAFHWVAVIWLGGALLLAGWAVRRQCAAGAGGRRLSPAQGRLLVWLTTLGLAGVVTVAALLAGGNVYFQEPHCYNFALHYLQPLFFTAFYGLAVVAALVGSALLPRHAPRLAWPAAALSVLVPLLALARTGAPVTTLRDYQPELVRTLDELADEYGLRAGITTSEFIPSRCTEFTSRQISLFSRKGLRAHVHLGNLDPFIHVGNRYWYTGLPDQGIDPPEYNFVVTDRDATLKVVHALFGEPAASVPCGRFLILIYNRPGDRAIHQFGGGWARVGHYRTYPADALPSMVGRLEDGARVATGGATPAGFLTYGPYVALPTGTYRVAAEVFVCDAPPEPPAARWELGYFEKEPIRYLGQGELSPGAKRVEAAFAVEGNERRPLEMRFYYQGQGTVGVRGLTVTREK